MSASVSDPQSRGAQVPRLFVGRARWIVAAVMVIGPLLQVVEFLAENPSSDNAVRVAYWAANQTQIELGMSSGLAAVPFLIGGVAAIAALTHPSSPRLAWTGAVLMTVGMVGLGAVHGYELAAFGLTRSGNFAAARSVLDSSHLGSPGVVLLVMFLGGATLGTLALAAAVWRSQLLPRVVSVFILAFAVLDFAVGQGVASHIVNLVGFSLAAGAMVAGYSRKPGPTSWVSPSAWW